MIKFLLNDRTLDVAATEQLGLALDVTDAEAVFDLCVTVPGGPVMVMLRNGAEAWLMFLRESGDAGFRSSGDVTRQGDASYTLSNGQVDAYPLAWCIDVEKCYKAVEYFCMNLGARPDSVAWVED